jgi:hypothetical protein
LLGGTLARVVDPIPQRGKHNRETDHMIPGSFLLCAVFLMFNIFGKSKKANSPKLKCEYSNQCKKLLGSCPGDLGKGCGPCSRLWRKWQIRIGKLFASTFMVISNARGNLAKEGPICRMNIRQLSE